MQKYHNTAQDKQGNIITTATVTVFLANTGTPATLYKDDEIATYNNPFTNADDNYDSKGAFFFKANNGTYDIKIVNGSDITWLEDVSIYSLGFGIQDNATTTAITIDSSENVTFANPLTSFLSTGIDDNATSNAITIDSNEDVQFVGTAQFAAGEGIVFNGDAITAANTLDDYEEGTWTPVLSDGTNNAAMNIQIGKYVKIGNQVTLTAYLSTSSLGLVSGDIRVLGAPFTNGSNASISVGYGTGLNIVAGQNVGGYMGGAGTSIFLRLWDVATGNFPMTSTEWSADGSIMFTVTYYI